MHILEMHEYLAAKVEALEARIATLEAHVLPKEEEEPDAVEHSHSKKAHATHHVK